MAAIGPDGTVTPCIMSSWMGVGNVREVSLTAILAGEAMARAVTAVQTAHTRGNNPCDPSKCDPDQSCDPTCVPKNPCDPRGGGDESCSPGNSPDALPTKELGDRPVTRNDPGPEFWSSVRAHTGNVFAVRPTDEGFSSDLTAVVECESGSFFVKAMRNVAGGRRESIEHERLINPHVRSVSPALRWYVDESDWYILGFDAVEGRSSDFKPGSTDLHAVVQTINRVATISPPDVAKRWPETRWNRFLDHEEEAKLFEGDALLHADINPANVLIGAHQTWLVDWSWPTTGAAFIDPACFVVQLIAAGHSPESAEGWAARCDAWDAADHVAVDAFAVATYRMYRRLAERSPGEKWMRAIADAVRGWAEYRRIWD